MTMLPTGRALIDPQRVLEAAGIRADMKIADLGVGTVGHFLFPAAKMVGSRGTVYGVDILKSVIESNQSRAKAGGVDNVELIWGDIERLNGTRLPDNSMDMVLMVNVIHLTKRGQTMAEVRRVMATGGSLVVIDWKPTGGPIGPAPEKRMSQAEAVRIFLGAGFKLDKEFEAGPYHFGLVFTK